MSKSRCECLAPLPSLRLRSERVNHMTNRTSSQSGQSCVIDLFALAGILLIMAGAIMAYPRLHDALTPPPAAFGEVQPPLRPTVTPLPARNSGILLLTSAR